MPACGEWGRSSLMMDQHVITKWCQPLRSSKNTTTPKEAFVDIVRQDPVPRKCSKHSLTVRKILVRDVREKGSRLKWSSITSSVYGSSRKKSRKTHLDTRVEGGAVQSGRKIARGVDVIICCPISNILYGNSMVKLLTILEFRNHRVCIRPW